MQRYTTKFPGGGESLGDVHDRMQAFLNKMRAEVGANEDVVVITHRR
jgi:broad specificity phosphatase PhoE